MHQRQLFIIVTLLCTIGLGLFLYKSIYLHFPLLPHTEVKAWDIEVRVLFNANDGPVKAYLHVPGNSNAYAIVNEQFISRGYGMSIKRKTGNRRAVWTLRKAKGEQVLFYRATIRPGGGNKVSHETKSPDVQEVGLVDAQRLAADSILFEVQARSADTETLVTELMKYLNTPVAQNDDGNMNLLLGPKPSVMQKLDVAVNVLGIAGIPARIAHGIRLQQLVRTADRVHLLQVYHDNVWTDYHPVSGELYEANDILVWWHGKEPLISVDGGQNANAKISVSESHESALLSAAWRGKISRPVLSQFSLLELPIETQAVYQVLLTVPIGVFLLVILRNMIGIKTFGTFMPVLIAMAFRETQLIWGIILFSLVVGLGLSVRFYLEHLKLLLVPRLAAVLIVVIILMALISVLSQKMEFYRGLSVALFPMVILAMTIERMSIVWEERGATEALQQGAGSLLVAALAYLLMQISLLQHLLFVFPELLLILLAFTLLLGRYSGYRLLELHRFKALAKVSET